MQIDSETIHDLLSIVSISFGPFKHRHAINKDFHYTEKQFEIEPLDWIHCHDLPLHDLTYTHTAM